MYSLIIIIYYFTYMRTDIWSHIWIQVYECMYMILTYESIHMIACIWHVSIRVGIWQHVYELQTYDCCYMIVWHMIMHMITWYMIPTYDDIYDYVVYDFMHMIAPVYDFTYMTACILLVVIWSYACAIYEQAHICFKILIYESGLWSYVCVDIWSHIWLTFQIIYGFPMWWGLILQNI